MLLVLYPLGEPRHAAIDLAKSWVMEVPKFGSPEGAWIKPRSEQVNRRCSLETIFVGLTFYYLHSGVCHIIRSDSVEDHTCALNAGIDDPLKEWRRPRGRPRQTWLRTVENDLKQQNLGLWSARHMTVNSGVKSGALKMLDVKMTDVKVTDQMTEHETAGHEIAGHKRA